MQTAVLVSGGLDSVVLLAEEASRSESPVLPVYVRTGLKWESAEQAVLTALLGGPPFLGRTRPLAVLSVEMSDVYASSHWAIVGRPPAYHTPDEDVYLPGRNIILLGKAAVLCATAGAGRIVVGTLQHNPFPDATPDFRRAMAHALSLGLDSALVIDAPFAGLSKTAVIERGVALAVPLDLTLSCMNPPDSGRGDEAASALHCGLCSKCRERHDAFLDAGVADPTRYADRRYIEPLGDRA